MIPRPPEYPGERGTMLGVAYVFGSLRCGIRACRAISALAVLRTVRSIGRAISPYALCETAFRPAQNLPGAHQRENRGKAPPDSLLASGGLWLFMPRFLPTVRSVEGWV